MRERFRKYPKFSLAGGVAVALVLVLFAYTAVGLHNVNRQNCQQIELVKTQIRAVLAQSMKTLGKKGAPGYEYYLSHLAELAQAKLGLQQELEQFAPRRC